MTTSVCRAIEVVALIYSQPIIELCCLKFAAFKWGSYHSEMVWSGCNYHLFSSFPPSHRIWLTAPFCLFFFLEACGCSIIYTPLTKSVAHLLSWFIIMFRMNCKDTSAPAIIHSYELDRYLEFFHFGVRGRYARRAGGVGRFGMLCLDLMF